MHQPVILGSLVLVTGANGFVGRAVVQNLLKTGYRVRVLVRKTTSPKNVDAIYGSICDAETVTRAVQGCDAVIHLAARKSDERDSTLVNVEGTRLLVRACQAHDIRRFVNVSTQSVRLTKRGLYGTTKLEAEHICTTSGFPMINLRPSVVYDDDGGGIFSTILSFTKLPIMPMIGGGNIHVSPIHNDDLSMIITRALSAGTLGATYDVGGPESITLGDLTREMQRRLALHRPILNIPLPMAMMIARLTSWMRHPPITVSNVLGAAEDLRMDIEPMMREFGIVPRTLSAGLDALFSQRERKKQNDEAIALLAYAFSGFGTWVPSDTDIKRFQTAIALHGAEDHRLELPVIHHPWLLGALDAIASKNSTLRKKILIAAAIGECSPATAGDTLPKNTSIPMIIGVGLWMTCRAVMKYVIGILVLGVFPSFTRRNARC